MKLSNVGNAHNPGSQSIEAAYQSDIKINTINKEKLSTDPRVKDWLLMTSPWPLFAILATYLVLIKIIVPNYMRARKPYDMRTTIKWYNIMQIVTNAVVSWGVSTINFTKINLFKFKYNREKKIERTVMLPKIID